MEIVQELAKQLGVAVENLLSAYAPYYLGKQIGMLVACVICIIASVIAIVKSCKCLIKEYDDNFDNSAACIVMSSVAIVAAFTFVFALCVFCCTVPDAIGAIFSPNGAAINNMITTIANSTK